MNFCNEDGTCTEKFTEYHEAKAKGGFGMIITEDFCGYSKRQRIQISSWIME